MYTTRQLAAIMFTDMVGYTALMQTNEELANRKRERHKKDLETAVNKFRGKILRYYGDGVNIASRIESLSVAGGVFISEKVYDDIKNQREKKNEFEFRCVRHTGAVRPEEFARCPGQQSPADFYCPQTVCIKFSGQEINS